MDDPDFEVETRALPHHPFGPSRLPVLHLCSGSHWMSVGLPATTSDYAERCRQFHLAITGDGVSIEFTDAEAEAIDRARTFLADAIDGAEASCAEMFLELDDGKEKILHGWADYVAAWPKKHYAIIIDWKFYRSSLPHEWPLVQGGALAAALLTTRLDLDRVDVMFYLPFEKRVYHHAVTRDGAKGYKLSGVIAFIQDIIKRVQARRLILNPSEHACKYCRALAYCPAARRCIQTLAPEVVLPMTREMARQAKGQKKIIESEVARLPSDVIFRNLETAKLAKLVADAIDARARRLMRIADCLEAKGEPPPKEFLDETLGYYLKEISGNRIVEPAKLPQVWEAVKDTLTFEEFLGVMSLRVGKLEDLFGERKKETGEVPSKAAGIRLLGLKLMELIDREKPKFHIRRQRDV
jgi:hypothetical protein